MTKMVPILKEWLISGVGLSAGNFESRGQPPDGNASIESFFKAAPKDEENVMMQQPTNPITSEAKKTPAVVKKEKKISDRTSNKRSRTGFDSFFAHALPLEEENPADARTTQDENVSITEVSKSPPNTTEEAVDADLELAKKLQASFDRENYVFSKVKQRKVGTIQQKKVPKKAKTIDAFFAKR